MGFLRTLFGRQSKGSRAERSLNNLEGSDPRDAGYSLMRALFSDDDYRFEFYPPRKWVARNQPDGFDDVRARVESELRELGANAVEPLIAAMNDVDRDKQKSEAKEVRKRAAWALGR